MKRILATALLILASCGMQSVLAAQDDQTEINKKIVTQFYDLVINQKDFAAAEKYLGAHYTQHNPTAADGEEGLQAFIQFLKDKYPQAHSDIVRVFAEGDYVILHVHSWREPDTRGRAIFDLFKLQNGKIIEHWDAVEDVPETSANTNGMF
jgi:predicted SnoaL-like aldol condensation-catalyzing enzyme